MISTPLVERRKQSSIHIVAAPQPKNTATVTIQHDAHPFILILVASIVAFQVAAVVTGFMAAWLYSFQNSGAFNP